MKETYFITYLRFISVLVLLAATCCVTLAFNSYASDANSDNPTSALGLNLESSLVTDRGHFEVFYNTPGVDPNEGVTAAEAEFAANCMECAWLLFTDPSMSSYPFKNPLGSLHFERRQMSNIPLWVRASCCDPCVVTCLGPG